MPFLGRRTLYINYFSLINGNVLQKGSSFNYLGYNSYTQSMNIARQEVFNKPLAQLLEVYTQL